MADTPSARRLRTVPFRMSHPVLPPMAARVDEDSGRETWQLAMLFPPGTDQAPFRSALKAAMVEKFGADATKWPRCKQTPDMVIRDFAAYNAAARKPLAGDWSGWIMIRANCPAKNPPGVVGPTKDENGKFPVVTDPREIFGGRWGRSTIDAYHFDIKNKNSGVTFGLGNVQLLKKDKSFSGSKPAAESDFDDASEEWSGQGDAFEKGTEAPAAADSNWG